MKSFLIATLVALTINASAFASPVKVNAAILSKFNVQYATASNVSWSTTKDYVKAKFISGNVKMEVYYNFIGEVIGTSRNISLDELPVSAKRSFAKIFSGYEAKEAIYFEGFDESAYYISGENEKESVIVKVDDNNGVSVFQKTKK